MEEKEPTEIIFKERPGSKDILFGRGNVVFNHIGNRRFRQVIDLFIEEYVDDRTARSEKTKLVRTVVKIVYESGYRFLKPDEEGVFAELGLKYVLKKVGHALRDRSPNLDLHLQKNLKTRVDLAKEGIPIVQYAESVTGGGAHDNWRSERYYTSKSTVSGRQLWVRPRDYHRPIVSEAQAAASSLLEMMSSPAVRKMKLQEIAPAKPRDNAKGPIKKGKHAKQPRIQKMPSTAGRRITQIRHSKSLNEIVVPTLQSASDALPIGGNWKFFPLPGMKNEIDLGASLNGWKLKLEPIGFTGDPISLDVSL